MLTYRTDPGAALARPGPLRCPLPWGGEPHTFPESQPPALFVQARAAYSRNVRCRWFGGFRGNLE